MSVSVFRAGGNGYRENTTSLNLCCEACSKDSPKCKGWFVPRGNASGKGAAGETADHCVLLDHRPEPLRRHNQTEYCVGATPPAWLPPPGCHERFVPMPPGQRVNWTATSAAPPGPPMPPGHHHGGGGHKPGMGAATRKVFHDVKSLGECCDKCYLDVQEGEEKMCRTWEMPGYPSNTTCFLYSGYSLRMSYMNPKTSNYTGRGARRTEQHGYPAPPPPPAPCTTPQPQIKCKPPPSDFARRVLVDRFPALSDVLRQGRSSRRTATRTSGSTCATSRRRPSSRRTSACSGTGSSPSTPPTRRRPIGAPRPRPRSATSRINRC